MIHPTLRDQDMSGTRFDGNIKLYNLLRNEAVEVTEATETVEVIEADEVSDARKITRYVKCTLF